MEKSSYLLFHKTFDKSLLMNSIHFNIKLVSLSQHEFYFTIFICDEFLFRQDLREIKFFNE